MGSIDDTISAVPGEWRFDQGVAKAFDSHVRKSVPSYDELQRMVVELSEYFVADGGTVYDLGSSTGETLHRLADYHANKDNLELIGVEVSEPMIEEARRKITAPSVRFHHGSILDIDFSPPPDLVTSVFTLQFLRLAERRQLLESLGAAMVEGGALILLEKTRGNTAAFEDMWTELYWDFKQRQGLTCEQVLDKARSLRGVLNPLTQEENLTLLRQSGFDSVEPFFKWYNWTGFLAIKNRALRSSQTFASPVHGNAYERETPDDRRLEGN